MRTYLFTFVPPKQAYRFLKKSDNTVKPETRLSEVTDTATVGVISCNQSWAITFGGSIIR